MNYRFAYVCVTILWFIQVYQRIQFDTKWINAFYLLYSNVELI